MAIYKKKPVLITAVPYEFGLEDGTLYKIKFKSGEESWLNSLMEVIDWKVGRTKMGFEGEFEDEIEECPYIKTLEGRIFIKPTDMIITGVKGERYPCKKDIFDMTYELV